MTKNLIFIENANQVDSIEQYVSKDSIVIAMHPSAGIELSLRGIKFENTTSFFGIDGHTETLEHSKLIVEGLRPFLKQISADGIQQSFEKTWVVYFQINLNFWLSMLFIINKSVEKYNPNNIIIINNSDNKNNSLSEVIKRYGECNDISVQYSKNTRARKLSVKTDNFFLQLAVKLFFEFQLRLFSIIARNRNTLLALSDSHNMPRLIKSITNNFDNSLPIYLGVQKKSLKIRVIELLKGKTFSFLFIPKHIPNYLKTIFLSKYDNCVIEIRSWLEDSNNPAIFYSVNLSNAIMSFTEGELKQRMISLYGEIISLNRILTIVKPKGVFAQHSLGIGYALGEVCYQENIPGLLIDHGSHTPQTALSPSYAWSVHAHTLFNSMYPFVAIQSPWAKKFLKKQDMVVSKSITTGPIIHAKPSLNASLNFEMRCKLFGRKLARKRIILHASSPRQWQTLRPWIYETVDEYIHNINSTIKAVEAIPDLYLCIRFRPKNTLSLKEFEMSLVASDCYGIYAEGSFEEFLMSSDILISYSSTTIEEALQSHIPVLQYDPDGKYQHIQGEVLSSDGINKLSTVYSVLTDNDLKEALKWWKENHNIDINRTLDWTQHVFGDEENEDLVKIMDIKC